MSDTASTVTGTQAAQAAINVVSTAAQIEPASPQAQAIGAASQVANNVIASNPTADPTTLAATLAESLAVIGAGMFTGGAAATVAKIIPLAPELISDIVTLFQYIHGKTAAPAPGTPAPPA